MRRPLESESSQIAPQWRPPGNTSVDTATLDLLSRWQQEDATTDSAQLRAAEEDLAVFMQAVNKARTASGEPLVFP